MPTFHSRIVGLYNSLRDVNVKKFGRQDFANFLGVSIGKSNGWIDGTGTPDFEVLKHISQVSGISILWFIGASNEMYIPPRENTCLPESAAKDYEILMQFLKFKYHVLGEEKTAENIQRFLDKAAANEREQK